ncbi:MAG: endonuclease III domain-containing protein [Thermodesulfobacteriota bacterium]
MKRGTDDTRGVLTAHYEAMFRAFGPQGWWPGRTRFEVIVGAILTQNTAWTNVEKAIRRLRKERLLTPGRLDALPVEELAGHIRSAGYFNVKARRLKNLAAHLLDNGGLARFLGQDAGTLRAKLLGINGVGPETADSIMLYAAGKPEFVVDAYTKRIFSRHGLVDRDASYEEVKALFSGNLPPDGRLFNEYHALIVRTAKEYCRTKAPLCAQCPLKAFLPAGAR